jgi:hypothetical protein
MSVAKTLSNAVDNARLWTAGAVAEAGDAVAPALAMALVGAIAFGGVDAEIQNVSQNGLLASALGAHIGLLGMQFGQIVKAALVGGGVVGTIGFGVSMRGLPDRIQEMRAKRAKPSAETSSRPRSSF